MPRRSDVITLIKLFTPDEETNERGFANDPVERSRAVRGNVKAVWNAEVFRARQDGYDARFKFAMYAAEYSDEQEADYNGVRYKVLRAEISPNGEFIELTCALRWGRGDE